MMKSEEARSTAVRSSTRNLPQLSARTTSRGSSFSGTGAAGAQGRINSRISWPSFQAGSMGAPAQATMVDSVPRAPDTSYSPWRSPLKSLPPLRKVLSSVSTISLGSATTIGSQGISSRRQSERTIPEAARPPPRQPSYIDKLIESGEFEDDDVGPTDTSMAVRAATDRRVHQGIKPVVKDYGAGPLIQQGTLLPGIRATTGAKTRAQIVVQQPPGLYKGMQGSRGSRVTGSKSFTSDDDRKIGDEERMSYREKWRTAINIIRRLVRTTYAMRQSGLGAAVPLLFQQPAGDSLGRRSSVTKGATDNAVKTKFHLLLSKQKQLRTVADFNSIDAYMIKLLPCLQRFSTAQRKQMFLGSLTYEVHPPRAMILRESGVAESVYFIISGAVEVYKDHRGVRLKQNLIEKGGIVGDVTAAHLLASGGTKRFMNVVCVGFCEFLRLDMDEYIHIAFGRDGSDTHTLVSSLNSHPLFQNAYETSLLKAAQNSVYCTFPMGAQIVAQGEPADRIFLLCKGTASVVRNVPFVKSYQINSGVHASRPQQVVQPIAEGRDPQQGEQLFYEEVTLCDISGGESFPELKIPPPLVYDPNKAKTAEFWPRGSVFPDTTPSTGLSKTGQKGLSDPEFLPITSVAVYASTEVQCVSLTVEAFLRLATNDMVHTSLRQTDSYKKSTAALQEAYLKQLKASIGTDASMFSSGSGIGVSISHSEED
ncbi:hypothetical protein DFS34DRAFT_648355 [Phlyctochytrium arcticum]|nr:hypothetical protein DFS34DRAFT_648355 [Phlyctochytrium arcticum]